MKITGVRGVPDEGPDFEADADFATFCRRHRPSLEHWYVWRWGLSPEDAADVAQEAFAGLARRWPMLATDEHRRRSYSTISRHKVVDFLRAQQRRVQPELSLDDQAVELVADEATTNPAVIFGGRERERLWEAVERMSESHRDAVVGRLVTGLSYDELAEATGRTPTALRKDVSRGLSWLRRVLKAPAAIVVGYCAKLRRSLSSSSVGATALTVASQPTLLGLVFTAPLYVLPGRAALDAALHSVPPAVVRVIRAPVAAVVSVAATVRQRDSSAAATQRVAAPIGPLLVRRPPSAHTPATTVRPPDLCLASRTCERERVVIRVLGIERQVEQSSAELCWAFPTATEPYVTCRREGDPP